MSRTAIVTGAAGDLGSVIAKRLADEGYKVAITDLHSRRDVLQKLADAITSLGGKVLVLTGDVTMEQDVQSIIQDTVKAFGPLEVMVSNVGKFIGRPLPEFTVEEWDDIFQINVKSMMLCYKTAANQMIKQTKENSDASAHYRIIGICSVAGLTGAPLCAAYAGSKFAVRGLTQATACDLGPYGITVNACAPGFIGGTKMVDDLDNTITKTFGLPEGAWRGAAIDSIKMKRLGEPRHIAALVAYLASRDAGWTTGQTIAVDGGMHLA